MTEAILERRYYVSEYSDEVPPHQSTLEGAASFLLTGKGYEDEEGAFYAEQAPLAVEGDVVALDVLELYANRLAFRGENGWELSPPAPDDAEFFAVRFGPTGGWDAESMGGSFSDITDILDFEDEEGAYIAVGRHANVNAIFRVVDGVPSLELPKEQANG